MVEVHQNFIEVIGHAVADSQAAHGLKSEIANVCSRAADEDNQDLGDIDGEFLVESCVVVDDDIYDLE